MTETKKRDQRSFDLVQRYLPGLILATVVRIVNGMDEPYTLNPGVGGKNGYLPRTMAIVCIMLEAERRTYRKMVGYLHADREAARKMGLTDNIPSKSTICSSYSLIPESYLKEVHARVIEGLQGSGSIAGDSTGYSMSRFEKWVDFRTDRIRNKHGWIKMHAIIDVGTKVVLTYLVTTSRTADIKGLYDMLDDLLHGPCSMKGRDFCLDAAYLSRDICNRLAGMGMTPLIKPKSNTVHNAGGSQAWRKMVDMYHDDLPAFNARYHQRSVIEAVFGAIKKMYGSYVRCRRPDNQRREIPMRLICYNIELIARSQVESGRLTRQSLEAITA